MSEILIDSSSGDPVARTMAVIFAEHAGHTATALDRVDSRMRWQCDCGASLMATELLWSCNFTGDDAA